MFQEITGTYNYAADRPICVSECRDSCRQICSTICYWEYPVLLVQMSDQFELSQFIQSGQ